MATPLRIRILGTLLIVTAIAACDGGGLTDAETVWCGSRGAAVGASGELLDVAYHTESGPALGDRVIIGGYSYESQAAYDRACRAAYESRDESTPTTPTTTSTTTTTKPPAVRDGRAECDADMAMLERLRNRALSFIPLRDAWIDRSEQGETYVWSLQLDATSRADSLQYLLDALFEVSVLPPFGEYGGNLIRFVDAMKREALVHTEILAANESEVLALYERANAAFRDWEALFYKGIDVGTLFAARSRCYQLIDDMEG